LRDRGKIPESFVPKKGLSMVNTAVEASSVRSDQDLPIVIADMPISPRHRNIALAAIAALAIVDAIVIPFANVHLARVDAFVPVLQTVMCAIDLLTAALLFAQYSIHPVRAVLAVASGYVFSGLFAFIQTLAFPGGYAPAGIIGDGLNSAAWFFVLWHTAFPLALIVYVLLKDRGDAASLSGGSTATTIAGTIVCVLAAAAGLTWLATHGTRYLPAIYLNSAEQSLTAIAIRGAEGINWLKRTPPDLNSARECFDWIIDASHRSDKIIAAIRGLFRKRPIQFTAVQINDVVREVLALIEDDLQVQAVVATAEYGENLPEIHAAATQIQQVILNLVKNGIEAMRSVAPGKRRLRLVTGFNGKSTVAVYIQDSGPGIASQVQDRIFDPFFTTKPSGTGLGLSICRTIVEDHGGKLLLSKTDAHGTSFELTLPLGGGLSEVKPTSAEGG
jgi:hypothetical protein